MRSRQMPASHGECSGRKLNARCSSSPVAVVRGHRVGVEQVDLADHHALAGVAVEQRADAPQQVVGERLVVQDASGGGRPPRAGRRGGSGPCRCSAPRRHGSRRRPGRARSAARRAWRPRPPGCAQLRSGCSGRKRWRYHWPVASSQRPGRAPARTRPDPVVRGLAAGPSVTPDVPVALRRVARRAGRREPRVLVGGVVGDPVEDDPDAAGVGIGQEAVEVIEGPEEGVDGAVVADVVAEVGHRRPVERREPQRVDAEPREVVEVVRGCPPGRPRRRRRCRRSDRG